MLSRRPVSRLGTLVAAVAFATLVAAVPRAAGQSVDGADWPRFLGPTLNGKSAESPVLTRWPKAGPPRLWQVEIGEGYSAPSISAGRLFLFDRTGDSARLRAFDAASGNQLWRTSYETHYEDYYQYSVGPRASPLIDGDRVYTFGVEGRLRCQNVGTGTVLWELDTTERFGVVKNFFGVGSTPIIERDLIIVPIGGSVRGLPKIHSGEVKGNGSGLVAFDKLTGEQRYSVSDELASYSSPVTATIDGRRWGFWFSRGGLLGFEPGSGKIEFHFPWKSKKLESVNAATPVMVDYTVFITESYGEGAALLRVGAGAPEVVWKDGRRNQVMRAHLADWRAQGDRVSITTGAVDIQGVEFDRLVEDLDLVAAAMQIEALSVDVLTDRHKPARQHRGRPGMPHDFFRGRSSRVSLDELRVNAGSIRFAERAKAAGRPGQIRFDSVTVDARNITNDPARMSRASPATARIRALFMRAAPVDILLRMPLLERGPTMSYSGRVGSLEATSLNEITAPLVGLRLTRGRVDSVTFKVDIGTRRATGEVAGTYRDLEMQLVDPNTGNRSLGQRLKSLAMKLGIRGSNVGAPGEPPTVGTIDYAVESDAPIFKTFWKALQNGLMDLIRK